MEPIDQILKEFFSAENRFNRFGDSIKTISEKIRERNRLLGPDGQPLPDQLPRGGPWVFERPDPMRQVFVPFSSGGGWIDNDLNFTGTLTPTETVEEITWDYVEYPEDFD